MKGMTQDSGDVICLGKELQGLAPDNQAMFSLLHVWVVTTRPAVSCNLHSDHQSLPDCRAVKTCRTVLSQPWSWALSERRKG